MARSPAQTPVYIRRNELARQRGFKSYPEQRKALRLTKTSAVWNRSTLPKATVATANTAKLTALYYEAFFTNPDDYSVTGPKARWFTEVAQIMSKDEWASRYPLGIREYHPVAA